MTAEVVKLIAADIDAVEALRAESANTLGFLPWEAIKKHLEGGGGIGIREGHSLQAYALYGVHQQHIRLTHLCVAQQHRGKGYAGRLLDCVIEAGQRHGVDVIKLSCRRDYEEANRVWQQHGFLPLDEKPAKTPGANITVWYLINKNTPQQTIFSIMESDSVLKVAIDAQIFYQLYGDAVDEGDVAAGLVADHLADSLELCVTDEIYNEINRAKTSEMRKRLRSALNQGHVTFLNHDAEKLPDMVAALKKILPSKRYSDLSDVQQLAMTAASEVSIFLTRDERILKKTVEIDAAVQVKVEHPNELLVRLHHFDDAGSYRSVEVSGLNLVWRRVDENDAAWVRNEGHDLLGRADERKGEFKARLDKGLSHPVEWNTDALWFGDKMVALRSISHEDDRLVVDLCRTTRKGKREMFSEYLAASLVQEAVRCGATVVEVQSRATTPDAIDLFERLGFVAVDDKLVRLCPALVMSPVELHDIVAAELGDVCIEDMERSCSPVVLRDGHDEFLMVPIKPTYARALFNVDGPIGDLFDVDEQVLLRWENVYFRAKNRQHMIQESTRILWYVSEGQGVVAVSHLDGVECGTPKDVFRSNYKRGTLAWRDISRMCEGRDATREVMAMRFSHTHLFRSTVPYDALTAIYKRHGSSFPVVRSPSRVPHDIFVDIFRRGFALEVDP